MTDEDRGRDLPQRVRGAARPGPPARAPSSPAISDELRQRIRAAVTAERSADAARPAERSADAALPVEDEVTEWLGSPAAPPSGITSRSGVGPPAEAESGVKAEPRTKAGPRTKAKPRTEARPGPSGPPPVAAPVPAGSARRPGRLAGRRTARLVTIVLMAAVLAATAAWYSGRQARGPADAAARRAEAAARAAAATWMARQVSRSVKVSCDPVMCAALRTRGFPPGELLVLGSASEVPTSSAVVVETPAVLSLFGSSLATAWAPAVLASFGSGPSLVTVRVIAPNGAAAYQIQLGADLADRRTAGAALLDAPQISATARAGGQLTAGAVDSRLLLALAALAGHQPVSIVQFGNPGPAAGPGVPLRYVDLAGHDRTGHLSAAAYVRAVRAYLSTLAVNLRPASLATEVLAGGQAALRVEFTAPSPLGLIGPQASS